jgi:hypothetical protein
VNSSLTIESKLPKKISPNKKPAHIDEHNIILRGF